jgi:hypothetical protein
VGRHCGCQRQDDVTRELGSQGKGRQVTPGRDIARAFLARKIVRFRRAVPQYVVLLLSLSSSLSSALSSSSSSPVRDSPTENFNRLRRAPPLSAGRDRLKRAFIGGVGGLRLLCMGSMVTFVQFTSASRCVDELGVCIIMCERKAGQRWINGELDAPKGTRLNELVTLPLMAWRVSRASHKRAWLFVHLLQQSGKRSGSA